MTDCLFNQNAVIASLLRRDADVIKILMPLLSVWTFDVAAAAAACGVMTSYTTYCAVL